jgi:anion-transporting  ArsA/GET3 family ATPase
MTPLDERRFVFITGKGGVGKTTTTAAMALALAKRGKKVLVTSCDAKERLSTMLGVEPLGDQIREIRPGVSAVKILPDVAMREYGEMVLKSRVAYKAVFENRYTRGFFKGVPGLFEWAMLGKAWYHSIEQLPDGSPRFDIVLFDAPATGHGLDMLRVPKIIRDIVPPGLLRRDAERAWEMFQDPKQSGVVVVTIPEDMPTNETIELIGALRTELELPVARLVVNMVMDELFSAPERVELLVPRRLDPSHPGDAALATGVRRAIRERVQSDSLTRLDELDVEQLRLPQLYEDGATPESIEQLSKSF